MALVVECQCLGASLLPLHPLFPHCDSRHHLTLCTVGQPLPSSVGWLQSWVICEKLAPVALLPGIALSTENTVPYDRHRRKAMISRQSPSLVLLVLGLPRPPPLLGSSCGPVTAKTLFMWHRPATPSSWSLFSSNRPVLSAVAACAVVGAGYRGFRPTASVPYRACPPTGPVPVGLRSFLSVATHLLSAGSMTDLPLGIAASPSPGLYRTSIYGTRVSR